MVAVKFLRITDPPVHVRRVLVVTWREQAVAPLGRRASRVERRVARRRAVSMLHPAQAPISTAANNPDGAGLNGYFLRS